MVFQNSGVVRIDLVPVDMQKKETELQNNDTLKNAFTEGDYGSFTGTCLKVLSPSKHQHRKC
jgi:hypothetical protein